MKKQFTQVDPDMKNGYIPAPYVLETGEKINDLYLEPVLFHNENGPTIGVTTCGVIVQDGLYFKDMDNDGVLSPYEDWRNTPEVRAADMVKHLPLKQQAGLVLNTLWNTPLSMTRAGAKDEKPQTGVRRTDFDAYHNGLRIQDGNRLLCRSGCRGVGHQRCA